MILHKRLSRAILYLISISYILLSFSAPILTGQNLNKNIVINGNVKDTEGTPLAGASIILKGTKLGTFTDKNGNFSLNIREKNKKNHTLIFSFIGMETREITVKTSSYISIVLKQDSQIEGVVVNGFYSQSKDTYTGAATTIKGEDIVKIAPTNLIQGIAALTPGMSIVENNSMGSNPNSIPSIIIRGNTSLISNSSEEGINNPLIILDGIEISISDLYDLDIFDIARVDILKDAAATILYGERGANGVIVIERKKIAKEKLKLSYNFVPQISYPDLSSYKLTNAKEKLEVEKIAGLYNTVDGSLDEAYYYKLQNIRKGVNTNWLNQAIRIPFSHNHSLSLSSRGDKIDYRTSLNFNDRYGVMKGDNRRNMGLNFYISYHIAKKFYINLFTGLNYTKAINSPYGSFKTYTLMNPYYPIYDNNGDLIPYYKFNPFSSYSVINNPLYLATLSNFDKKNNHSISNSLQLKYYFSKFIYLTSQINHVMNWSRHNTYISPQTPTNTVIENLRLRGRYDFSNSFGESSDANMVLNYGRSLDRYGSILRISIGANARYSVDKISSAAGVGFLKDNLNDLAFALSYPNDNYPISYPNNGHPNGKESLSTQVGFFANTNISLWNRYFMDLSFRESGSSRFGSKNYFAPFWSAGIGWNLHRESFIRNIKEINSLTLRYSLGYTGSVSFNKYQAKTIYRYGLDNEYYTGIGALPVQMGNPDLKYQRTFNHNIGVTAALFNNRLNFNLDLYSNTTYDLVMPIELPPSVGTNTTNINFGEINNKGLGVSVSMRLIQNDKWFWNVSVLGSHVFDKIKNISNSLKDIELDNTNDDMMPKILFREGGSQFDIYAMKSAGIDPATGNEIFIKKDGTYTYNYMPSERVVVGNSNPIINGYIINTIRYKGFALSIASQYSFGSDYYNSTLQTKVESANLYYNVDERVFSQRWKKVGDISRFTRIKDGGLTHYSQRFVERRNEVRISNIQFTYDFTPKFLTRLGLRKLAIGFGLSDVAYFSSIRFERGTDYPYSHNINIIFRPSF